MKIPRSLRLVASATLLSLVGCSGMTPEAEDVSGGLPRAPFDTSMRSGEELAAQLVPKHRTASHLLAPITDTTFLERFQGVPMGRVAAGKELFELDLKFQAEVANLVDMGVIAPTTLVIDDTGHSVPNLAQMMNEPSLGVVGTVHLSWNPHQARHRRPAQTEAQVEELMRVSLEALADQVQTFGDVIAAQQEGAARRMATVLYIAIDGERYLDLRTAAWPTAQDYMIFGLTRVVVLIERSKLWHYGEGDVAPDLMPYVRSLREGGMPVQVAGVDARTSAMISYGRPRQDRPSGGAWNQIGAPQ